MPMIHGRYTLFTRIPLYVENERVFTDSLWAKDLELHFPYISDFSICCPVESFSKATDTAIEVKGLSVAQIEPLRRDYGYWSILKNIGPNFLGVAKALRHSQIVHSGGAGWAFPLSFYILALRPFNAFEWVVVIESSSWMKPKTSRATPRQWLRHHVYRILLGACLRRANARIFTTENYRQFFGIPKEKSLIAPAVWIDDDAIITEAEQDLRLAELPEGEIRLIFPARLVPDKGSDVILAAVEHAETLLPVNAPRITLDIIGTGPLSKDCRTFAERHEGRIAVNYFEPVSYGVEFFKLLRSYHAMLLANRQQEQPRVIFDSFSQGLPIISSATEGVREIVTDGKNALLYEIDDAEALADCIIRFATDQLVQASLTKNALETSLGWSHEGMHHRRLAFFEETLKRTS